MGVFKDWKLQTVLPKVSRSKGKEATKFGQLTGKIITREIFFLKNHAENEAGTLEPDLFLFFKKDLYNVKASGLQLSFNVSIALDLEYNKNKLHKTLNY